MIEQKPHYAEAIQQLSTLYGEDKVLFLCALRFTDTQLLNDLVRQLDKIENIIKFISESDSFILDNYEDFLEEIVLETLIRQQISKGDYDSVETFHIENKTGGVIG